jgi:hypothetical protein
MNKSVQETLSGLTTGEAIRAKNVTVFPIFNPGNGNLQYTTLDEAMAAGSVEVTEVNEVGSVPNLKVTNSGEIPILIFEMEELIGAKQNRILNTSVLVAAKSSVTIPVSCVEANRWHYSSRSFKASETHAPSKLRRSMKNTINENLRVYNTHAADQGEVWAEVDSYRRKAGICSRASSDDTGALKDAFDVKKSSLDAILAGIKPLPGQNGMAVFINGELVGMDYVSSEDTFARLHDKLLRGYAMDAVLEQGEPRLVNEGEVIELIRAVMESQEETHKSPGEGNDHSYSSPSVNGSALVHDGAVISASFFKVAG